MLRNKFRRSGGRIEIPQNPEEIGVAMSTYISKKPFETIVTRVYKGIKSSPALFKDEVDMVMSTSSSDITYDPSEAKTAAIVFFATSELMANEDANNCGTLIIKPSRNAGETEVSVRSSFKPEVVTAIMGAVISFIANRTETEFDADIVAAIQNDSATAENNETEAGSKTNRTTTNSPKLKIVRIIFWISLALSIITFIAFFPLIGYDIDLGYGTLALLVFFFAVLIIDYSYLYFGLEEPIIDDRGFAESLGMAGGYAVLGIIVLAVLIVLGTCAMGGGGSSKSHSTEETAEFLTNIDTPGTSEYKWYHDEYLPDNDLPDR